MIAGVHRTYPNSKLTITANVEARLLKHLAAMGTIYEADVDQFLPTRLSKALTQSMYADGFPVLHEVVDPPVYKLHEHLSRTKYQNPKDPLDCPFQLGHGTRNHYFQWMQEHPKLWTMFNNHMTGTHAGLSNWMDKKYYPLEENLVQGAKLEADAIFFIDVGGGNGHDLEELCRQNPQLNKCMILQDQASVIDELKDTKLDFRIQPMAHNFFQPQPIKGEFPVNDICKAGQQKEPEYFQGARAYYMHRIMHDWPDSKCHEILTNLKSAMTPGYSKLLLYEMVIPDRGAQGNSTGLDILMMSLFAACERTTQGWKILLESAGFRIIKIWPIEPASESLIEAELA